MGQRSLLEGRGRLRLASPVTALVAGGLALVLTVSSVPLSYLAGGLDYTGTASLLLLLLPFACVGTLVAHRQPRNPIGWILLTIDLSLLVSGDFGLYAVLHYRLGDRGLPLARGAVFLAAGWIWMVVLLPLAIALFPDGRLPSRRWRWVLRTYLAVCAILLAGFFWQDLTGVLAPRIQIDTSGELAVFNGSSSSGVASTLLQFLFVAISLAWVLGQVIKYRSSTGEYRQQLKWLLTGGAICITSLVLGLSLGGSHSALLRAIGSAAFLGIVALPIGIGVAILRYRLYEIDRLISRTISYAILSGLLIGIYLGVVTLTTRALPLSSPVGVAASTLAAAALFNPLRRRVQRLVERRFNRARYDAEATIAAFAAQLRDAIDLNSIGNELVQAVDRAVEPSHASLWIRPPSARARA